MVYIKRFFKNLMVIKLLLISLGIVSLFTYMFNLWFTSIIKVWDFLFGFTPTSIHVLIWAGLLLLGLSFLSYLYEVGQRYARTPATEYLLSLDRFFCILIFSILLICIYGFIGKLWFFWFINLLLYPGMFIVPSIYFLGFILLPIIISCFSSERSKVGMQLDKGRLSEEVGYSDDPIQIETEDKLGRSKFVTKLQRIINSYQGNNSLIIGMNGAWGNGKTSVLNLLRSKLLEDKRELIVIDFNPWYFNDDSILIREFFKSIAIEIKKQFLLPGFNQYIESITKLLQSSTAAIGPIGINFAFKKGGEGGEILKLKEKLQNTMKKINKKIIILIDDVDRLAPNELILMFKLIRLCADFQKFIYLLSYDRKIVCDLLQKIKITEPNSFLEKIVQVDVRLPEVEKQKVDSFLGERFDEIFKHFEITLDEKQLERLRNLYNDYITNRIQNLRHAKRLIASLVNVFGEIKEEVNIIDIIALEALRIFAYPVWHGISQQPQCYVFHWGADFIRLKLMLPINEEKQIKYIKEHIENSFKGLDTSSQEFSKKIIEFLFPAAADALEGNVGSYRELVTEFEREQRVAHPDYLKKYLQLQVPSDLISDEYVIRMIDGINQSPETERSKNIILEAFETFQLKEQLYYFIQKLIHFAFRLDDIGDMVVIDAIREYSDKFDIQDRGLISSDMDRARALLYVIAYKYKDSEKIQQILIDTIIKSRSMYFVATVIFWCSPSHNSIISDYKNIDIVKLKLAYKKRFRRKYVEQKKDIFATEKDGIPRILIQVEEPALVTDYMISLFDKRPAYIGKLLFLYVETLREESRERWQFPYEWPKNTFEVNM